MPDYRRFIAYFYEYIDGKRQRNAGFVKAEQRDGIWRISLQLKGRRWLEESLEIYGYRMGETRYPVSRLAKGFPQTECLIRKFQLSSDWKDSGGKHFEELEGMWIPCGEKRCFISHWGEGEADPEKLTLIKEQTIAGQLVEQELPDSTKRKQEPQECLTDMKRVLDTQEDSSEIKQEKEEEMSVSAQQEQGTERDREWKMLKNCHPAFYPLRKDTYECITICPRDVLWLRQQGWPVGRNSFLLQGFSQYRHLLLGRRDDGKYILGVPGIDNPQMQNIARAFGYGEFEKSGQEAAFGYWCRKIQ